MFEFLYRGSKEPEKEPRREGEENRLSLEEAGQEALAIRRIVDGLGQELNSENIGSWSEDFDKQRAKKEREEKLRVAMEKVHEMERESGKKRYQLIEDYLNGLEEVDRKALHTKLDELFPDKPKSVQREEVENIVLAFPKEKYRKANEILDAWGEVEN